MAAAFFLSCSALGAATWKVRPLVMPSPVVRTRPCLAWRICEVYGSHTAHASTLPEVNAASASAGCRYLTLTSPPVSRAVAWPPPGSGGRGGRVDHLILYAGFWSPPAAPRMASDPPFWSPTLRVREPLPPVPLPVLADGFPPQAVSRRAKGR